MPRHGKLVRVGLWALIACALLALVPSCFPPAPLTRTSVVLPGVAEGSLAWGDYDGDGDLDLAIAGWRDQRTPFAAVCRNDQGTFADTHAGLSGVRYGSLAWGDYDSDGDLDLVIAGRRTFSALSP